MIALLSLVGALAATTFAQVAYKKYSLGHGRNNLYATLLLFGVTPLLTYVAVKAYGIGLVYISTSVTYVLVALMGKVLFAERISRRHAGAMVLILTGSLIYGLGMK